MTTSQPENIGESLRLVLAGAGDPLARLPMMQDTLANAALLYEQGHGECSHPRAQMRLADIKSGGPVELLDDPVGASLGAVLHAPGWDCDIFASADRELVFAMVEMLLGGDGDGQPFAQERAFSRIESNLVELFFLQLADALSGAFALTDDDAFTVSEMPAEISSEALGGGNAVIALARFDVEFSAQRGQLRLIIPAPALDAMRQALPSAPVGKAAAPDDGWRRHIESEFGRSKVTLVAVLDEVPSTLAEISGLKVGQVLDLAARPDSPVRVECNGESMFWCRLGQSNGAYTLQIENGVDTEQEFIDDLLSA